MEERLQHAADEPVDQRVDALVAGAGVQRRVLHVQPYPRGGGSLQLIADGAQRNPHPPRCPRGGGRRGGLGRPAAARQEGLRRRVRRRRAARQALHARAGVAPDRPRGPRRQRRRVRRDLRERRPQPARAAAGRGVLLGARPSTSATWPATMLLDRFHPAAGDFPALWGNPRAFAQATWRHALFGFVLGELERRLNPPGDAPRRSTTPRSPPTATARPSIWSRPSGRSTDAGPHHRGVRLRRAPPRRPLRGGRRRRGGPLALDRPARRPARRRHGARGGQRRGAGRRLPPRRPRARRRVVAEPEAYLRDNAAMTLHLLEAVRDEAPEAAVVVVGSSELYGPPAELPVDESAPLRPQNPYAVSKASADLLAGFFADAHDLRIVRARAFNHAGPGPGADLRDRLVRAPDRGGARSGRGPGAGGDRQPRRAARLHRRARRRARLPRARPSARSPASTTSAPAARRQPRSCSPRSAA